MWLLAGQKAPDHSTIARFRTGSLADACEDLFYQMIKRLEKAGELSKETVFIDGTKLEACANKYTFVWKKSVGKWETKMFRKIQEAVLLLNQEYMQRFYVTEDTRIQNLQEICRFLEQICKDQHTVFVQGRGKRKSRNQKHLELFRRFLERQTIYDWHTASFQDRNDVWTLVPFLKGMEKKLGFRYPSVTADSGYESEEGYTYLREQEQKPYIKPQTYEKWKKRSFKKDISKRENMGYDEATDIYTCHAGKKLQPLFIKKQKSKSGYESEVTVYECEDCTGCPYKEKCTKAKGNKRLYISKSFLEKRQESYENIPSKKGIQYRMNRSIQVERAFGVLKNDYEFQRFLLRGENKVKLEILLLCMGYNLNKLHSKIQKERTGTHLFEIKETA